MFMIKQFYFQKAETTLKGGAVCVQNGVAAATVSFWNGEEKKDGKVFPSGTEE